MNMEKEYNKKLSICIPTYNRAERLCKSIPKWIEKIKEHRIPIFISDNASTDNTNEVVVKFQEEYPFIFYHRNTENIGPDKNFQNVLEIADTDYRWLMGDDDELIGELSDLLLYLEKKPTAFIIKATFDKEKNETLNYRDMNSVLFNHGAACTYLSTIIFSREMINEQFRQVFDSELSKLSFAHMAAFYTCLAKEDTTLIYVSEIYVEPLSGNEPLRWSHKAFQFFCNDLSKTAEMLPEFYDKKSKLECAKKIRTECWGWTQYFIYALTAKRRGLFRLRYFFKSRKNIKNIFSPTQRFQLFMLAFLPTKVVNLLLKIFRKKI